MLTITLDWYYRKREISLAFILLFSLWSLFLLWFHSSSFSIFVSFRSFHFEKIELCLSSFRKENFCWYLYIHIYIFFAKSIQNIVIKRNGNQSHRKSPYNIYNLRLVRCGSVDRITMARKKYNRSLLCYNKYYDSVTFNVCLFTKES